MSQQGFSSDELRELYRELILDHAKQPRHFGKLAGMTHSAEGINPLCGDKLHLYLQVDDADKIVNAQFEGTGCAISVASASLLTDKIAGMNVADALKFFTVVTQALTGADNADDTIDLGKLRALEGVREFPSRVKCATLAWHAMNAALGDSERTATTE